MNEQKFKSEMRRAEIMRQLADDLAADYWAGYIRGLRRAHHGKKFGTAEEHEKWMNAIDSDDESQKQRGRGYRDGLALSEISSRIGRPQIGELQLGPVTVTQEMADALEAKAKELGVSVAEIRRRAYAEYLKK